MVTKVNSKKVTSDKESTPRTKELGATSGEKGRVAQSEELTTIARGKDATKSVARSAEPPNSKSPSAAKPNTTKPSATKVASKVVVRSAKKQSKPNAAKANAKKPSAAKVEHVEAEEVSSNLTVANGIKRYASGWKVGTPLTKELMLDICKEIAEGGSLHRISQRPDRPCRETFFERCRTDPWYAARYNEALQARGEYYADQLVQMADEAQVAPTPEKVAALKLMVNTRQWVVARLLPRKYGDKVVVQGDSENPLVTQVVVGAADIVKKIKGGE
jgi:hypothetical protein